MKKTTIFIILLTTSLFSTNYKTIQRAVYKKMQTEPKVALVIGNQNYKKDALKETISDASRTKNFLESVGFKVIYATDIRGKGEMRKLVNQFLATIEPNGVGLFYFSGHGMSANNENYLIPTENSSIAEETDIEDIGFRVNYLLKKLENKGNRLNIVILDACRNSLGRGADKPLFGDDASGVYIAYATAMGSKARDNGVFTSSFIRNASISGLKIEEVFKRVRVEVSKNTEGKQIPFTSSGLKGDFFFVLPKEGFAPNNSVVYREQSDDSFLWWLLGGLTIALVFLLFLLLKPKLSKPIPPHIDPPIPNPKKEPKSKPKKREIKGAIEINGLIYQNQPFTKQLTWNQAKEYAKNLRLGGFDDWRLPTREELRALGNIKFYGEYDIFWEEWYKNHKDKALINSKGEKHFIRKEFLENMPKDSWFWTSEAKNRDDIWRVGFNMGCDDVSYDEDMSYVLCVREKREK
jgi:uncharacterized caspase-like protein